MIQDPRTTISQLNWDRLQIAHYAIRQCRISEGMRLYRTLLDHDIARFIRDGSWGISDDPTVPSANWACIYLGEYFLKERVFFDWLDLFSYVEPHMSDLSNDVQSRLISLKGWAYYYCNMYSLQTMIDCQQEAIARLSPGNFETALHEILLGYLHRQHKKPDEALRYGKQSLGRLDAGSEPFYTIRARDYLATSYDAFSLETPEYRKIAAHYHQANDALIARLGKGAESEKHYYSLGWHHLEKAQNKEITEDERCKEIEIAMDYFERGLRISQAHSLRYEENLNYYGLSVAYLCHKDKDYDAALHFAQKAMNFFWGGTFSTMGVSRRRMPIISVSMTATCLNIIARVYKARGDFDLALTKAHQAYAWHEDFDNPVQREHIEALLEELAFELAREKLYN